MINKEDINENRVRHANGTCKGRLSDALWRAENFASVGKMDEVRAELASAKKWLQVGDWLGSLSSKDILIYEVYSSLWAQWIGIGWLQKRVSSYFAWKVNRKWSRCTAALERRYHLKQILRDNQA